MTAPLRQTWPRPANPKPIVVIGAGGITRDAHLPAYRKAGFPVKGVFDLDPAQSASLAADWDLPQVYESLEGAVADNGLNAVYDLATPPHAIAEILRALPDGAAALIQKPMGADLRQAREIRAVCAERKLKAAVNFQLRFAPMMMAAIDGVRRGLLGDLLEIEVHLNIFTPWKLFPFLIPMQRVEIAVHSIHYLDAIRAVAGDPVGVFARSMGDPRARDWAQTRTSAILDYGGDLRVLMSINHNHQCGRRFQTGKFRFEGTRGAMAVKMGILHDYPRGEPDELWICESGGDWRAIDLTGNWFVDAFIGTMSNVQRFDAGEDAALVSPVEDAFRTMALVEACFEANDLPGVALESD